MNVAVAGSIIFHHFAVWAGYEESPIFGEKFQEIHDNKNEIKEKKENNNEVNEEKKIEEEIDKD